MPIEIEKGAKEWIGVQITERDDGNVTATADFQVYNSSGVSVQAASAATITGSGTAKVYAEGLVDTSTSGFTSGEAYEVKFTITIGSALPIARRYIKLVETRL